jgi:hypothetical protein
MDGKDQSGFQAADHMLGSGGQLKFVIQIV